METSNIVDFAGRDGISDGLTDFLRTGAHKLIAAAVEAELESFLDLSRFRSAPGAHLGGFPFESQGTFPA